MKSSQQKKQSPVLWIIVGMAIAFSLPYLMQLGKTSSSGAPSLVSEPDISLGDKVLLKNVGTAEKQAGAKAFLGGDYNQALTTFEASLSKQRNDPEALIYFNNATANRNRLPLFGSSTTYTYQTLKQGQSAVQGMVLPAVWHPQNNRDSVFPQAAKRYWGGEVSWRTATSYDATMALGQALGQAKTRDEVQQALRQASFSVVGAGDAVRFDPQTGDRVLPIQLLQIKASQPSRSGTGFDFTPLENLPK
jgi:tetratricopeptide (TPR) repeat protein